MSLPPIDDERNVLAKTTVEDGRHTALAVVEAVGEATQTPVEELPPLERVIDTDALDRIYEGRDLGGFVTFEYIGYLVCVHADGQITIMDQS